MSKENPVRAVFCGDGTLLIQCAEVFREAGGEITAVISSDPRIRNWASEACLALWGTPSALDLPDVSQLDFDYLFSVANLTVLPANLITLPKRAAINFHDGPLPDMAGLNTPAWALIEGREHHSITWHEMVEKVDAGDIYRSASIEISPTETALSLNTKCYEAGLESFRSLLADLSAERIRTQSMSSERHWYGRAKRPENMGFLQFDRKGVDLCRLVRGLNFGNYHNPLCKAKFQTEAGVVLVSKLELGSPEVSAQPPGRILAMDATTLTVAAGDRSVILSGLSDLLGDAYDPTTSGLTVAQDLPNVLSLEPETLVAVGRDEAIWGAILDTATPALPPYPRRHLAEQDIITAPLATVALSSAQLTAGFLAWSASLLGNDKATVALRGPASKHPGLSDLRPMAINIPNDATCATLTVAVETARTQSLDRAPMAIDLMQRLPDTARRDQAARALSVVWSESGTDEDVLGSADLALVTDIPRIVSRTGLYAPQVLEAMAEHLSAYLHNFSADCTVGKLPLAPARDFTKNTEVPFAREKRIEAVIAETASRSPNTLAVEAGSVRLTFADLEKRATRLAGALAARGAGPGVVVGLCHSRSADLVVALLAILKTGAAYLPLDPSYPANRLSYMIEDSEASLIVTTAAMSTRLGIDPTIVVEPNAEGPSRFAPGGAGDLAYLIYTSGSTGLPKGVMVPHRTVMNFFAGMEQVIPLKPGDRFLSVTSISFDISVLEIFWTLSRGATLILHVDEVDESRLPDFSLFYFASEAAGAGHHAYRLLLEGARFADENGFAAIWTPERHFHAFGGLYPNPAISSAALAGLTKNVKLRAGSSVLPLHHPVRVAEDWALVDNLSNGRAGVAIASGWQPNDFIVRPDAFTDRKDRMLEGVETLRKLWRGEPMQFPGHDGKPVDIEIHPKPMQSDLPLWLTAAGNPETFAAAARMGCGVLTHLLGQTFEEVTEKIKAYRVAWREAGHPGTGNVVLMLHTFVAEDEEFVRDTARDPMKGYLKSAVDLVRRASWTFPTIVQRAEAKGVSPQEMFEHEDLSPDDLDGLLNYAFERYYRTSGLFGTPESAKEIVRRVAEIGVDEIACLIDFGIDTDLVLNHLPQIRALMTALEEEGGVGRKASVAEEIVEREITHLQCTPSMAAVLAADIPGRTALARLETLMVGGEAFPLELARTIREAMSGVLLNMYGPTETTIWSSVARLEDIDQHIPLGLPVTNTILSIRAADGREVPDLVEGELWIGGEGVAIGYLNRPELNAERFIETPEGRFYRTGDLVRRRLDGALEFLGRMDLQVKVRGYRIELGEIETALAAEQNVREAVVKVVEFGPTDQRLVGYVTTSGAVSAPDVMRANLHEKLPDFMVPAIITTLEMMPLTPNGKTDRKALPVPSAGLVSGKIEKAGNETETVIAKIWGDALGLANVSVTENFFDLGGHSLLVVQVQRQMKEQLNTDVAVTDIFRFPTIRALADHLNADQPSDSSAARRGAARAAARLARRTRH